MLLPLLLCYHTHKNEFSFYTVFMKRVLCFYTPSLWRGDIKYTSFINTLWNEFHFRFFLSHVNLAKTQEKHSFIEFYYPWLWKTRQRRGITYEVIDELRRLSQSKCFRVLCHKLIYEIAIFHSMNRETCDKKMFPLAPHAFLGMLLIFLVNFESGW